MPRIAGLDIAGEKRADIGLRIIYGVGKSNVYTILATAKVSPAKRIKDLTEEELNRLQKVIEGYKVEGDLRREVQESIKRLKEIGSYRGLRHARNLPARGQRTRSNARTRRGKRATVGAIRKKIAEKMGLLTKEKPEEKHGSKKG